MYFVTGGVYDIAKDGIFNLVFGANESASHQQGAGASTSNKTGSGGGGQQPQFGGKNQFSGGNQDLAAHSSFTNNANNDRNNFNISQENESTLQRNPNRG
jgi:hypothetical protein